MNKPPVLNGAETDLAIIAKYPDAGRALTGWYEKHREAQRDANAPYITRARDEGWDEGYTAARLEGDRRVTKAIEQARQETVREMEGLINTKDEYYRLRIKQIFEEIEKLWPIPEPLKDRFQQREQ